MPDGEKFNKKMTIVSADLEVAVLVSGIIVPGGSKSTSGRGDTVPLCHRTPDLVWDPPPVLGSPGRQAAWLRTSCYISNSFGTTDQFFIDSCINMFKVSSQQQQHS